VVAYLPASDEDFGILEIWAGVGIVVIDALPKIVY
jgi:hypothetical protein